jgi:TrkA domain protein
MEIRETTLPEVGLRNDFTTRSGRQLGVVSHRTGRRDLIVYNRRDPDAAQEVVRLTAEKSDTLAELLGSSRVVARLAHLQQQVEGLAVDWLPIVAGSPYAGGTIADTQALDLAGCTVALVGCWPVGQP